jgi:dTDP-4-amino-4,6-dideoxygalactose transaminase
MSHDAWNRYSAEGSWYYEVLDAGYKYNMTDIQAALGLHQLARLEGFLEARRRLTSLYTAAFSQMPEIIVPKVAEDVRHAWHLYLIRLQPGALRINRNQFIEALHQANIGTSVHFIPLHRHPYYRERYGYSPADFPVADTAYQNLISLPLHTRMMVEDVNDVIGAVENIIVQYRR